ncbi:MAG: hypothetical protein ACREFO_05980 [Acetobacteraceae bacterium]
MSLSSWFSSLIEDVAHKPRRPSLFERIEGPRVTDDPDATLVDGKDFDPGGCYFGLRLAGLHLRDWRRLDTEVLPLCVCLAEFHHAGKARSVPFSVGPDTIIRRLQSAQGSPVMADGKPLPTGWVELRDIPIVRPTPFSSGNVELVVGLCSVPGDHVVRALLNVMGSISRAFGGAATPALGVASTLYDGFATLLGLDRMTLEVAGCEGRTLRKSGYLLVSNAAGDSPLKGKLFVSGGRLRYDNSPDSQVVTDFDYCLLAVERYETVLDKRGLAPDLFEEPWQKVLDGVRSSRDAADRAFRDMKRIIFGSSDLIKTDRDVAMVSYQLDYEKALKSFGPPAARGELTRGIASGGVASALAGFSDIYGLLTHTARRRVSPQEKKRLNSGVPDPALLAKIRAALANTSPGAVADAIMRAS